MKELKFNGSKLVTGPGAIDYIKNLDGQRIFVVTGKSAMFKNGTIDHIRAVFAEQGKTCEVYSGIGGNPTTGEVLSGLAAMKAFDPDTVMAVGGGSAIDATKVMTLMCEYPELTLEDIRGGKAPAERRKLQFIAAPSTSGTASEVTRAAVITFTEENIKVGLKTTAFIPDIAILDGNLTLSMPKHVMVETGMDALTHAVESYINKNNDDFCKFMSRARWKDCVRTCRFPMKRVTLRTGRKCTTSSVWRVWPSRTPAWGWITALPMPLADALAPATACSTQWPCPMCSNTTPGMRR